MSNITDRIVKLKALAMTAKTSIYNEEAMTALELAGVTACKVNECVDIINEILDVVEELLAGGVPGGGSAGLTYNAESEEVII